MAQSEGDASLSRQKKGFTVPASPFNAVKVDLALLIIVGGVLWLIHDRLVEDPFGQFLLLAGYGAAAMGWIVIKTRRVAKRLAASADEHGLKNGEK